MYCLYSFLEHQKLFLFYLNFLILIFTSSTPGEYDAKARVMPVTTDVEPGMYTTGWPMPATGGHIFEHVEPSDTLVRKSGGLNRHFNKDCTIKDQYSYYYGTQYRSRYGDLNAGSRNQLLYKPREDWGPTVGVGLKPQ